jgi:uncharacterized OB-fold protein
LEPLRGGLFEVRENGSGYLLINHCERCGLHFFLRRMKCIRCLKEDKLRDSTLSGSGKLYTYTVVYRSTPDFKIPYMVGYIDFEQEGLRVFSQLTGCQPEELQVGMDMEMVFEALDMNENEKRKMIYKFRPHKQD